MTEVKFRGRAAGDVVCRGSQYMIRVSTAVTASFCTDGAWRNVTGTMSVPVDRWTHLAITWDQGTKRAGNYRVTGERWHYIRYADGSEELYDRGSDPHEWTNLATKPEHAAQKSALAKHLPDDRVYPAPGTSGAKRKMKAKE